MICFLLARLRLEYGDWGCFLPAPYDLPNFSRGPQGELGFPSRSYYLAIFKMAHPLVSLAKKVIGSFEEFLGGPDQQ